MGEDRLTQDELALVLRRAAELDVTPLPDERLSVEAVEAAAAEVGLPPAAVRQAVAELRAGLLRSVEVPAAAPAPTGPAVVVEAAVLPFEQEQASAEVGRWLEAQTFQRHRGRDGVEVWREREDWVAGMQRRFDWSASVRLKGVHEVVVRAIAVEDGTLVRLEATLTGVVAAAPGVGLGAGGAVGVAAGLPFGGVTSGVAVVALGGAGVLGGWFAGRKVRRNRRDRIADELAAVLDRLATGRTADQSALTRLRQRVSRHGGRWA